jgi:predicted ATP-grasp superfamily ATP-dependent carboligase
MLWWDMLSLSRFSEFVKEMRVFVYECVCAGGLGPDVPASLLREGRAMLDAVCVDFQSVPGVEVVNAEQRRFRETAANCDWTLVIAPEFDDHLRSLSQTVLDVGGRLLGSLPAVIALTGDKLATAEFWHGRGVRHPRTVSLDVGQAFQPDSFKLASRAVRLENLTYTGRSVSFPPPWVMKPRHGAGSQATFLIRNREDGLGVWSPAFHECDDEFIVQEYVRGQAASVALLIAPNQTIPLMPARQHLSNDGRFRYQGGSLPLPPALAERATRIALAAVAGIDGLQGYVGVDLVLRHAGDDYAIEINPRLTTSYIGLRQLCRGNLAELMLKGANGDPLEAPHWEPCEVRFGTERLITPTT